MHAVPRRLVFDSGRVDHVSELPRVSRRDLLERGRGIVPKLSRGLLLGGQLVCLYSLSQRLLLAKSWCVILRPLPRRHRVGFDGSFKCQRVRRLLPGLVGLFWRSHLHRLQSGLLFGPFRCDLHGLPFRHRVGFPQRLFKRDVHRLRTRLVFGPRLPTLHALHKRDLLGRLARYLLYALHSWHRVARPRRNLVLDLRSVRPSYRCLRWCLVLRHVRRRLLCERSRRSDMHILPRGHSLASCRRYFIVDLRRMQQKHLQLWRLQVCDVPFGFQLCLVTRELRTLGHAHCGADRHGFLSAGLERWRHVGARVQASQCRLILAVPRLLVLRRRPFRRQWWRIRARERQLSDGQR